MQTPWMPRADPEGMVRQAQARTQAAKGQRSLPRLVFQAHLGQTASARPAGTGTLLSGVRRTGLPHTGHCGGPCSTAQGQLESLRQPRQPPELVQVPSRPENSTGTGPKSRLIFAGSYVRTSVCAPAHGRRLRHTRPRRLRRNPPPTPKKFWAEGFPTAAGLVCEKNSPIRKTGRRWRDACQREKPGKPGKAPDQGRT